MSRDDFLPYAKARYNEIPAEERVQRMEEWTAELEELKLDLDSGVTEQDDENQRSAQHLEVVKSQLQNMVRLRHQLAPWLLDC